MSGKQRSTKWQSTPQRACTRDFVKRDGQAALVRACAALPPAPPTASPQLLQARELLKTLPSNKQEFIEHLKQMRAQDPVQGALSLHWCFSALAQALPPGTGQKYFQRVAEASLSEALQRGWGQYGLSPWDVVHHTAAPQMPRYNSEPILHNHIPPL